MTTVIRKYIIEKCWLPTIAFFISIVLFFALSSIEMIMSSLIGLTGLTFLFLAGVIQLFNKKWLAGFLNLGLSLFTAFVIVIFTISFIAMLGPDTDTFADNLKLPENVKLEKPIDTGMGDNFEAIRPDSITQISKGKNDFQLYNSFQPGLYEYDLWIDTKHDGIVFLKAYEITQEIELSCPELKTSSRIGVRNTNGAVQRFSTKSDFTIYEGDWGKPYGARFEVWFQPDDDAKAFKLLEKNYIIEGWMR